MLDFRLGKKENNKLPSKQNQHKEPSRGAGHMKKKQCICLFRLWKNIWNAFHARFKRYDSEYQIILRAFSYVSKVYLAQNPFETHPSHNHNFNLN